MTAYHKLGGLKQQTFIFLQIWRTEVHGQGAGRVGFLRGLSPWLAVGHSLSASSHDCFSLHLLPTLSVSSPSYKNTRQIRLGPTLTASFQLKCLFKGPVPNTFLFLSTEVRTSPYEFGGGTVQPVTSGPSQTHTRL